MCHHFKTRVNPKISTFILSTILTCFAILLASCGGGGNTVSITTGSARTAVNSMLSKGPITGATCTLYSATNQVLSTSNSSNGSVSFGALAASGPVYVNCTGGTYTDESTGATDTNTITFSSAGVLVSGQPLSLAITPLTTLA